MVSFEYKKVEAYHKYYPLQLQRCLVPNLYLTLKCFLKHIKFRSLLQLSCLKYLFQEQMGILKY